MSKDPNCLGQPVLSQLFKLLPSRDVLLSRARRPGANRYYKTFDATQHLHVLLFAVLGGLETVREVTTALAGHESKLQHVGINGSVARSTFAHSNKRRNPEFFLQVYSALYESFKHSCLDSRLNANPRQ